MASLIKLLEESLLFEGRIKDVLKKYDGKVTPDVVNKFVAAQNEMDPKLNNKYLDWMVKQYTEGEPAEAIIQAVSTWHKNLPKLTPQNTAEIINNALSSYGRAEADQAAISKMPKDINTYSSLKNLLDVAKELVTVKSGTEKAKQEEDIASKTSRTIYEDDHYKVVVPLSYAASCKFGKGSKWCIAMNNTDQNWKSSISGYIIYYVIDKYEQHRPDHPMFKVAVLISRGSEDTVEIWNSRDARLTMSTTYDPDKNRNLIAQFFPMEIATAMLKYKQRYIVDLSKWGKKLNAEIGKTPIKVNGWQLTGDGINSWFQGNDYKIQLNVDLKNKHLNYLLYLQNNTTKYGEYTTDVPDAHIKDIEDIIIEHNQDPAMLAQWFTSFNKTLAGGLKEALKQFQPIITAIESVPLIESKVSKIGVWHFAIETKATESNRKTVFKAIRKWYYISDINEGQWDVKKNPKEKVVTYNLYATIDFGKYQFNFDCNEDKGGGDTVLFDPQAVSFDKSLIYDIKALSDAFFNWLSPVVNGLYNEG